VFSNASDGRANRLRDADPGTLGVPRRHAVAAAEAAGRSQLGGQQLHLFPPAGGTFEE
jgi:hypothetical protein